MTSSTEERTALYRSLVDGKRILIVLDNASNAAQVRPLLPGSPDCLVVVTSRNQMAGLVAAEGATLISLDVLADDEAHEMLARRLGRERVAAESQAADEIIEACAGLPLALSIAVGRATAGRAKRPLARAGRRTARRPEPAGRAGGRRRGHRRAGRACPGPTTSSARPPRGCSACSACTRARTSPLSAAASLAGISRAEAGAALRELTRTHMAAEHLPGRFAFHDLLRVYAADQAERHDPRRTRSAAVQRVLDHYLHTAMAASQRFSPFRSPLRLAAPAARRAARRDGRQGPGHGLVRRRGPGAAGADRATPAPTASTPTPGSCPGRSARSSTGAAGGATYAASQRTALAAAQRLDDTLALAHAHYLLGHAQVQMSDYDAAEPNFRQALDLFRELGDRANEAVVLNGLAGMLETQERYPRRWPSRWTRCGCSRPPGTGGPRPPWRTASAGSTPTWASTTTR